MVQILKAPERMPSFSERLGEQLSSGISKGMDYATKLSMKQMENKQRANLFGQLRSQKSSDNSEMNFGDQVRGSSKSKNLYDKAEKAYLFGERDLGKLLTSEAETAAREEMEEKKRRKGALI